MDESAPIESLAACSCCGLVQTLPQIPRGHRACCVRCETTLRSASRLARSRGRTTAFALSAIALYPLAVGLPMIRIEQFGHHNEASILAGTQSLLSEGHLFIGLVVLACSVIFPLFKLCALLLLSGGSWLLRHHHRALTYHMVEWTGRWGMLDVLLVAVLVAVLKLGDMVEVSPGPAAVAFVAMVILSLMASASFDSHLLWTERKQGA